MHVRSPIAPLTAGPAPLALNLARLPCPWHTPGDAPIAHGGAGCSWRNHPTNRVSPLLTLCHHAIPASLLAYAWPELAETIRNSGPQALCGVIPKAIGVCRTVRAWLRHRITAAVPGPGVRP
ncbi:hypothetical protein GCM10023083_43740 [Streptomyces phyllanthi]